MPKKRSHRTKLAPLPSAKEVKTEVDPKLEAEWKKIERRIEDAKGRGADP